MNQNKLSIKERLCFCTTRIDAKVNDTILSHGTGFFFNLIIDPKNYVQVIITNKHMVKNKQEITFYLSQANEEGNPAYTVPSKLTMNSSELNDYLFYHPDESVDLCAIAIKPVIDAAREQGLSPFYAPLNNNLIPTNEKLGELDAIEEVLMIGYPNALWDSSHNMPLIRKGITATNPRFDYNGRREFLIDAACVPGSSGSPVFICNVGTFYDKTKDDVALGNRLWLLGVQYAIPVKAIEGTIKKITLDNVKDPIENSYITQSQTFINLGYIIKSSCILDLIPIIKETIETPNVNQ